MRIAKMVTPALVLVGLCLLIGAVEASAATPTGVCNAAPNEKTKECNAGTYYPEGEKFKGSNLGNVSITDKTNTIVCKKSNLVLKLGKNPSVGAVSMELTEIQWEECEIMGGNKCTMSSPAPKDKELPWSSLLQWTTFGTTGPNGTHKIDTFSVVGKCGNEECSYVGAGAESSITGNFYNANDTNKPATSTRAEVQFNKVAMNSGIQCTGAVEFSAVYALIPGKEEAKNVFIANG